MKIVFFCEDNFGLNVLQKLCLKHRVVLVVCLYKNKYSHLSIKNFCKKKKIKFFLLFRKPEVVKKLYKLILKIKIDLIISCHFNFILSKDFLKLPKLGCLNLHPSLLPKYRGQSPQHWPILNFDKLYGLTVHYMSNEIDKGNILFQKKLIIPKNIYISSLQENLRKFYTPAIFNSINLIKNGSKGRKQNENKKIYKGKISTHDMLINLNDTIEQAFAKIRAFSHPYNGARFKNFIIWRASNKILKIKKKNGLYRIKNKFYLILKNKALTLTDYNEK